MKRFISLFFATLALTIAIACEARAQTPISLKAPTPTTPVAQPNADQKARLAELAKAWEQSQRDADSKRDKYLIQLMATLAELGLKPSETSVTWNEKGEPVFNRVEQAKTAPKPLEIKPEAKP